MSDQKTVADIRAIPAFSDNYIWAWVSGSSCVIVDPGEAAPVRAFLAAHQLSLSAVLITHHHADHTGGLQDLLADVAKVGRSIPVFGPQNEAIDGISHPLGDAEVAQLPLGFASLKVMTLPGHTLDHIAFVGGDFVFCGDTLFAGGCGRLFEGSPQQMHTSLSKLAALPGATRVFCAHEYTLSNLQFALTVEPDNANLIERQFAEQSKRGLGIPTVPSTIALERETNPFLRCNVPSVRASVALHLGEVLDGATAAHVFAALRRWKDVFKG